MDAHVEKLNRLSGEEAADGVAQCCAICAQAFSAGIEMAMPAVFLDDRQRDHKAVDLTECIILDEGILLVW